jgi:hypothetical protein
MYGPRWNRIRRGRFRFTAHSPRRLAFSQSVWQWLLSCSVPRAFAQSFLMAD